MAVFLNLCDEDTGKSFTALLNKALIDSCISTTFFSPAQQQPSIVQEAIKECAVFIAVFSVNYASSFCCLHQLCYLLSLPRRRTILPVFYDVDPSHHVSMRLICDTPLHVAAHRVGLDLRVDDVMRHLEIDANDVRMIGIHGMGLPRKCSTKYIPNSVAAVSSQMLESLPKQMELSTYRDNFLRNFLMK
ncbi:hypothetical protein AMTRI_Chr05g58780 [Amborella trichopoda]